MTGNVIQVMGRIIRKAGGIMEVVLHALLDRKLDPPNGQTWNEQTLASVKYAVLGVRPDTGSHSQDVPLRADFGCAGITQRPGMAPVLSA